MSRAKFGSQETALQQQRALARWEGEGGASPTGPPLPSPHPDNRISGSPTITPTELPALYDRDERG